MIYAGALGTCVTVFQQVCQPNGQSLPSQTDMLCFHVRLSCGFDANGEIQHVGPGEMSHSLSSTPMFWFTLHVNRILCTFCSVHKISSLEK